MSGAVSFELFAGNTSKDRHHEQDDQFERGRPWWWLVIPIVGGVLVLVVVSIGFIYLLVEERRTVVLAGVEGRLQALAAGRAETLGAWLEAQATIGRRLSQSELVQLYVAESGMATTDVGLRSALNEQRPYMRQVVNEFAAQHGLVGVYVMDDGLKVLLRDRDAPDPTGLSIQPMTTGVVAVGAPRLLGAKIVVDVGLPIPAPQRFFADPAMVVGRLVMTFDVTERFERVLGPDSLSLPGERAELVFKGPTGALALALDDHRASLSAVAEGKVAPADSEFGGLSRGGQHQSSYVVKAAVPGTSWTIVQEQSAERALAPVRSFATIARWSIGAVLALMAAISASLLLWQRARYLNRLVRLYRDLAGRLMQQKKLLTQVTTATRDWISLKDQHGRFLLVNPAFVEAVGCSAESMIGKTEEEVLSPSTSAALAVACRGARDDKSAIRLSEETELEIGGDLRHLEVASDPILDEHGEPCGALTVFHDVTELATERQRRNELSARTVGAFQRAVELTDPYLLGHTHRLQETVIKITQTIGLSEREVETVRLAAGLSQLGKLFVPKHIVAKQGRHDEDETRAMQQHVSHAVEIVEAAGLSKDVAIALVQMHERLDGSGYPNGLAGDDIVITGRVLAVADVFCARTAPRSYRDRLGTSQVLALLRENTARYDRAVVDALEVCLDDLAWANDAETGSED